jgi:hypothetical protein
MALTAQFTGADAGLAGQIVQTARTDPATNPDGVNQVRFTGKFIDDSPDYRIGDLSLYNAKGKFASLSNGGGVGSFFGAHAQGTMGAFSATNMDAQEKDPNHVPGINLLGSFSGTTSDNNP